jgi:hypothetical protein
LMPAAATCWAGFVSCSEASMHGSDFSSPYYRIEMCQLYGCPMKNRRWDRSNRVTAPRISRFRDTGETNSVFRPMPGVLRPLGAGGFGFRWGTAVRSRWPCTTLQRRLWLPAMKDLSHPANLHQFQWQAHCRGLFELPMVA